MFRSQAVFCVESLFLSDNGGQEARGVRRESDADFLLRANFRSSDKWQQKKADHQETKRGLLHDSLQTEFVRRHPPSCGMTLMHRLNGEVLPRNYNAYSSLALCVSIRSFISWLIPSML